MVVLEGAVVDKSGDHIINQLFHVVFLPICFNLSVEYLL